MTTITIFTVLSPPVQFDYQIEVGDCVEGWQNDVEDQDYQDCLHLHQCLWKLKYRANKTPAITMNV